MRTKSLFLAAAALAVGIASSSAQGVYSQNVVGYINLTLSEGFNMVSGQLDADGTGTNNTISSIFSTNLPAGSAVYVWNGTGFTISGFTAGKGGGAATWDSFGTTPLNPGIGCFVSIPAGAYGGATGTVTLVGNVLQGAVVNRAIPSGGGFAIIGSQVPVAGGMQTTLNYTPSIGDACYFYNPGAPFGIYSFGAVKGGSGGAWGPSEPQIAVGQGFWFFSATGAGWTNNFTVQ